MPDIVILAVKPQILAQVLPAYARYAPATPFLSMAAGKTLAFFTNHLGAEAAIVRVMPNLPVTVLRGVTGCVANDRATVAHKALASALMQAVGAVHWVDESQIDALSAVPLAAPPMCCCCRKLWQRPVYRWGYKPSLRPAWRAKPSSARPR